MKLSILTWMGMQLKKQPPVVAGDLTGKTVLVLGANTGIGLEATKHFARMNPKRLILACRSESRGQAAIDKIKAQMIYDNPELWLVDLLDFDSVKRFCDKFEADGGRLDILVLNAAMATQKFAASEDGFELSMKSAGLSTPYVALRLLPVLIRTARVHETTPRLVFVASETHYWVDIEKNVLDSANIFKTLASKQYSTSKSSIMAKRYMVTKLLNVLFVRALAGHLPSNNHVVVNAVNPGMCATDLNREMKESFFTRLFVSIFHGIFAFTAEEGARFVVSAAVGEPKAPEKLHGQFLMEHEPVEPSDFAIGKDGQKAQERLWDEILEILGEVDEKVTQNVESYLGTKM